MTWTPDALAHHLSTGLLSFPVTAFDDSLEVDEDRYREHLAWQAEFDVVGLFAAGGTGEGFSLSESEVERVVNIAVSEVGNKLPVMAPALGSTVQAVAQAQFAERSGAAGILLFPPYLTEGGQAGLIERVSAVCRATSLGVIVYNRANGILNDVSIAVLADRHSNLIAVKDGVGNIELITRIFARLGDRLMYIGGLPTAETFALPMLQLGVTTYSSAIYNFAPAFALEFYSAVRARQNDEVYRLLRDFVLPYTAIRDRVPGYAVSIIKAGLKVIGRNVGSVRSPLQDLTEGDLSDLASLFATARIGGFE